MCIRDRWPETRPRDSGWMPVGHHSGSISPRLPFEGCRVILGGSKPFGGVRRIIRQSRPPCALPNTGRPCFRLPCGSAEVGRTVVDGDHPESESGGLKFRRRHGGSRGKGLKAVPHCSKVTLGDLLKTESVLFCLIRPTP